MMSIIQGVASLCLIWLLHALVGGIPLAVAWFFKLAGHGRAVGVALLIVPFAAQFPVHAVWPIGGASSFFVRLSLLTVVVLIGEAILLLPAVRRGPVWSRILVLAIVVLCVVPIQLSVPSLPD